MSTKRKSKEKPTKERKDDEVTRRLNRVYAQHSSKIDPVIYKLAVLSLGPNDWEKDENR